MPLSDWWPAHTELATFLGTDDVADEDRATLAIELAAGAVLDFTSMTLELVADDEVVLDWEDVYCGELWLPELPVVSVSDVDVDGTAFTTDHYFVDRKVGSLRRRGGTTRWGRVVTVTYTHGFAVIPDNVRLVTLRAASRLYKNPTGKLSESRDGYSGTLGRTMTGDMEQPILSTREERMLRRYKR